MQTGNLTHLRRLGGAETIANVLACVFYCLGQRPDVVEKIRAEITEMSGGQSVRAEDIKKYTYTECTMKEVLRMYPVAFVVDRVATQEIQLGPYTIPKDVSHHNDGFYRTVANMAFRPKF